MQLVEIQYSAEASSQLIVSCYVYSRIDQSDYSYQIVFANKRLHTQANFLFLIKQAHYLYGFHSRIFNFQF